MVLYNVTVSVDQVIEIQFIEWLRNQHIQAVLETGCFTSARLSRLTSHEQPDSTTYVTQYLAENEALLNDYKENYAETLRQEGIDKFGDKIQAFRTELEVLEDFYAHRS